MYSIIESRGFPPFLPNSLVVILLTFLPLLIANQSSFVEKIPPKVSSKRTLLGYRMRGMARFNCTVNVEGVLFHHLMGVRDTETVLCKHDAGFCLWVFGWDIPRTL